MNMLPPKHEEPDINLTPLIDVVFLLLIFFMVTASFIHESELKVDLPKATSQPTEQIKTPIHVSIDREGKTAVNGQHLTNNQLATLMRAIKKAAGNRKHPPVIISADAKTNYQAVVTAMDAAQQLGFERLSLATKQRQSDP